MSEEMELPSEPEPICSDNGDITSTVVDINENIGKTCISPVRSQTEDEKYSSSNNGISEESGSEVSGSSEEQETKSDYDKLSETIAYQQEVLDKNKHSIISLEEKVAFLEKREKELEQKLESAIKQKESAIKEKEAMVIRYAVGEKNVMKEREQREIAEKSQRSLLRENEILQHKVQTMIAEKARICQMLDNKCYEYKNSQQELERTKADLNALETKLKWSQNSLKNEMEAHKECQSHVELLTAKLQEATDQIEKAKADAEATVKNFYTSQENRAFVLDQQVKEQQAALILIKHERDDREQQVKTLQAELGRLQTKQTEMLQENNALSLKVQQLERERHENEQKLSELRGCADQQRQDFADLQAKSVQLEQMKLQLKHEQDQLSASNEQINLLKQRNQELETDMESCRVKEADLLIFTQQLTDKNVKLQSEFTAMETKVQQLTCEHTLLKRQTMEQETKASMLSSKLAEERAKFTEDIENLQKILDETTKSLEQYKQEAMDQKGENVVMKRKYDLSLREVNKELHQYRKRLENVENVGTPSSASSSSSVNAGEKSSNPADQVQIIQREPSIDKQTLLEHIVKLQRNSAKKSEKIDFLEEHINTLVAELQKKTKLLQGYILREQSGTLTSNSMDKNKAKLAKFNGIMASMYNSRVADESLTLELCLDINRKLQAILEDTLLKNITLKENVDTLGEEIDRLNMLLKTS